MAQTRDHHLDAAKGALVILVVLGHMLEAFGGWRQSLLHPLLAIIYLFHIPAFVFLAGVTARSTQLGRRVLYLAVLLVSFQVLYVAPVAVKDGAYPFPAGQPYWILWFLLSLMCWTLLLPAVARAPRLAFAGSVLVAACAGLVPAIGYDLTLSRTLVFLPFFVGGYLFGTRTLAAARSRPVAIRAAAALALVAVGAALVPLNLFHGWYDGSYSFHALHVSNLQGLGGRALLTIGAALGVGLVLVTVPVRRGLLARVGEVSQSVYLLHGVGILAARHIVVRAIGGHRPVAALVAAVVISAAIVAVTAIPAFDRLIRLSAQRVTALIMRDGSSASSSKHRSPSGERASRRRPALTE